MKLLAVSHENFNARALKQTGITQRPAILIKRHATRPHGAVHTL